MSTTTRKPGRPKVYSNPTHRGFRLSGDIVKAVEDLRKELDPKLSLNFVVELLLKHCMRQKEAGKLRPADLFGKSG